MGKGNLLGKIAIGALVVGGGLVAVAAVAGGGSNGSGNGTGSSTSEAPFETRAKAFVLDYVAIEGCAVVWKNQTSRTAMAGQTAFWSEAVGWATAAGSVTPDEVASKIAQTMIPGCPWPPEQLVGVDIQKGVDGLFSGPQLLHWNAIRGMGRVDFYLTIRSIVVPWLDAARRGGGR